MADATHLYQSFINQASRRFGIPASLLERQIKAESGGNPHARSPVGALGLMQLMPSTARGLGVQNPFDPEENIMGGAKYLRDQFNKYGSWKLALAAYNAGPAAVAKYGGVPPFAETRKYIQEILGGIPHVGAAPQESPTVALPTGLSASAPTPPNPLEQASEIAAQSIPTEGSVGILDRMGGMAGHIAQMQQGQMAPLSYVPGAPVTPNHLLHVTAERFAPQLGGGMNAVQAGKGYLGVPYKWGGTSRQSGMDCSGFIQNVFRDIGIKLPRTTYEQVRHGQSIPLRHLQPGDVVFTEPGHAGPNHVGLYVGHGMIQESPHTGTVNSYIPLKNFLGGGFVAARRYARMQAKNMPGARGGVQAKNMPTARAGRQLRGRNY